METNERFARIATASSDVLKRIDAILLGKEPAGDLPQSHNLRLLTVTEACKMLNMKYPTFYRSMKAGCFDIVTATGKTLIREESVIEFSMGRRGPSEEAILKREERARGLREEYKMKKRDRGLGIRD